jgi:DNA ligase 1
MPSPTKRRKIDKSASKTSPASSRTLDYFFSKHKKDQTQLTDDTKRCEDPVQDASELTDEQLAKRLQAQWDQESGSVSLAAGAPSQANLNKECLDTPSTHKRKAEVFYNIGDASSLNSGSRGESAGTVANLRTDLEFTSNQTLTLQSANAVEHNSSTTVPLDESALTFEPHKYVRDLQKDWATDSGDAFYSLLTKCFVLVNSTQSRIKIVDTLVNLLRTIIEADPSSLLPTVRISKKP